MPTVKRVESQIRKCEKFEVKILRSDYRDLRSDKKNLPSYPFDRAAKGDMRVGAWTKQRFTKVYPGYAIEVLQSTGRPADGRMSIGTVRDGYGN